MNAFYESGGFNGKDRSPEDGPHRCVVLQFPDSVRQEVYAERIRINQDRGLDPRDAHGTYLRMKIAAAFCLLDYPVRHSRLSMRRIGNWPGAFCDTRGIAIPKT